MRSFSLSNAFFLSVKLAVGHLRDIEESGHSKEVKRRVDGCMSCMDRPPKKKNETKMARVER